MKGIQLSDVLVVLVIVGPIVGHFLGGKGLSKKLGLPPAVESALKDPQFVALAIDTMKAAQGALGCKTGADRKAWAMKQLRSQALVQFGKMIGDEHELDAIVQTIFTRNQGVIQR